MNRKSRRRKAEAEAAPSTDLNAHAPPLLRSTSSRILSSLAAVATPLAEMTQQAAQAVAEEAVNGCVAEYIGLLLGVPSNVSNDSFDISQAHSEDKLATPGELVVKAAEKWGIPLALRVFDAALSFKNLLVRKQAQQDDKPANSVPPRSSPSFNK